MKKKSLIILLVMVVSIIMVGCSKKEEKKESEWKLNMHQTMEFQEEEFKEAFDNATKNYKEEKLSFMALLGEQVVAGKNYMILCEGESGYKVVVLYRDLKGNASITHVNNFDFTKYVNKDIEANNQEVTGGWQSSMPGKAVMLEEKLQAAFDSATSKLVGVTYYPITVFEQETKAGKTYAIICYGRMSDQKGTTNVYVMTLNVDEKNNAKVASIASIDLSEYNK